VNEAKSQHLGTILSFKAEILCDTYLRVGATRAWLTPARHAKEVKLRAAANMV
jgi:hypothetical protein